MEAPVHGILGRDAELAELGHMSFPRALVAALKGDVYTARSDAEEGLRQSLHNEDMLDASCNRAVLGFLELSLSNPGAAMDRLEPVMAFLDEMGSPEPGVIPCVPDAVEALVSLGRLDEAEGLVDRLERQGRTLDRPWAIATAGRGRGLLSAARGDLSAARSALEQALVEHRRVPQPFELARTLLVKGEVERRARQKRAARSALEQTLGLFQDLGAPFWAQRAQDDLARVGGAVPASSELTPTEQRIAQLVGEGRRSGGRSSSLRPWSRRWWQPSSPWRIARWRPSRPSLSRASRHLRSIHRAGTSSPSPNGAGSARIAGPSRASAGP